MAKYKKRADGRYCTSIMLEVDGKKKKKYVYGKTIKEVDDKIAELRSQSNKGVVVDDRDMTVGEYAQRWIRLYKRDVAYNTQYMYSNAIEKHIVPKLGHIRLSQLKRGMVQEVINDLMDLGHCRTAEIVKNTLQQVVAAALDEQYIQYNCASGIKIKKENRTEKRPLTRQEIRKIQNADLPVKSRAFIYTLLFTGIRRGEALALTVNDVDFKNRIVRINKTIIYKNGRAEIKNSPKTSAGVRDIPIPDKLAKILKEQINLTTSDILFPMNIREDYMTLSSFVKFWENIRSKTNIGEDVTAHTLRHTYATQLYYNNVDPKTAQYLLGHSSIKITLDLYTHLDKMRSAKKTVGVLNDLYKNREWVLTKKKYQVVKKLSVEKNNGAIACVCE